MKISIGSDHRGFDLKNKIVKTFRNLSWIDVGTNSKERTDYPIFAKRVCNNILSGDTERGILICGSGIGMSIAANRFKGIYAAICWNSELAKLAVEDDCANVLILPVDFLDYKSVVQIVNTWLHSKFKAGRYEKRLKMVDK